LRKDSGFCTNPRPASLKSELPPHCSMLSTMAESLGGALKSPADGEVLHDPFLLSRISRRTGPESAIDQSAFFFAAPDSFARYAAQRFFVAAAIAALPAALSLRIGFGAAGASEAASPLAVAHLFLCPAAIFFRAAALILRRGRSVGVIVAASTDAPESTARNSAI
jgi:hypothetical protein